MKKLLAIFSWNLIFYTNPLLAHEDINQLDIGMYLGQMGAYCLLANEGLISEKTANEFMSFAKSFVVDHEDIDITVKTYVQNFRFSGKESVTCNRFID